MEEPIRSALPLPVNARFSHVVYAFTSRVSRLYHTLNLEESPQPPDLEDGLANDDTNDKQVPPLDAGVGALGGVAVDALADDNVLLLVLDLGKELGEALDFGLERVCRDVGLAHVDNAVDVEGDLLAVGAPVLVAEAVHELAVVLGREGVVAVRDGSGLELVAAVGSRDPKVNVQVAGAAKLAVADLVRDRHDVVLVQGLVETLGAVGGQDNVVGGDGLEGSPGREQDSG
jgi:hypothetical protein